MLRLEKKLKIKIIWATAILVAVPFFLFTNPISQEESYHFFAGDCSQYQNCRLPNFANVFSNIGFIFVGIWGFLKMKKIRHYDFLVLVMTWGIISTGLGSAYYHWQPNTQTLFWDRLPMTLVFMSFFGVIYGNYFGKKEGKTVGIIGILFGLFSVVYWIITEKYHCGDLRPYVIVQFLPVLLVTLIICLNLKQNKFLRKNIIFAFVFYTAAKLCEHYDHQIFHFFAEKISGHNIKHLLSSVACIGIVLPFTKKEIF
jgi:hypothetical protein